MRKFVFYGIVMLILIILSLLSLKENNFTPNNTRYYICERVTISSSYDIKTERVPNNIQTLKRNLRGIIKAISIIIYTINPECLDDFISNDRCWRV